MKQEKTVKAWVGLINDKVVFWNTTDTYGDTRKAEIFKSRKEARKRYQGVVRVTITYKVED